MHSLAISSTSPGIGADELRPPFQQWAQANAIAEDPNSPGANGLVNQVVGLAYPLLSGGVPARFFRLVVGLQ